MDDEGKAEDVVVVTDPVVVTGAADGPRRRGDRLALLPVAAPAAR